MNLTKFTQKSIEAVQPAYGRRQPDCEAYGEDGN